MQYEQLGNSGLKISKIILGAMSFGSKEWYQWIMDDEEEIFKLLKHAYDKGLRTWDTANIYSYGESERWIARFIEKYNIRRSNLTILSKCNFGDRPIDNEADAVNATGLSRKAIFDQVEASIERLGTYIDVLQIHRYDPDSDDEEIMQALNDLVRSGKVRYIGASSMKAYQFAKLQFIAEKHNWTKFVSMQNQYSLIYREEEREMIPFCKETGVGLIPYSPNAAGILTRPYGTGNTERERVDGAFNAEKIGQLKSDKDVIDSVEELAKKRGVSMSQIALAWILHKGTCPIVGFSSTSRIDEAIGALKLKLTEEEVEFLEKGYVPHRAQF